jgi:hypothetical protein
LEENGMNPKALLKHFAWTIVLSTALFDITACAQTSTSAESANLPTTFPASTAIDGGAPKLMQEVFAPGPDGSPLPARTAEAARNWPSEFKHFLDTALQILKSDGPFPTAKQIADGLGIQLQEIPAYRTSGGVLREFRVVGVPFGPTDPNEARHSLVLVGGRPTLPSHSWHLHVLMDQKRLCINPYEVAIYLGEPFTSTNFNPHSIPDGGPPSYTWGLFKRGMQGTHLSKSIRLATGTQTFGEPFRDPSCIRAFSIVGLFTLEK